MPTPQELQILMGMQGKTQQNPWSSMMSNPDVGENQSSYLPPTEQAPSQVDMAIPPMEQPTYGGAAEVQSPTSIPSMNSSSSHVQTSMNPEMLAMYKKILAQSQGSIADQKESLKRLEGYRSNIENKSLEPDYTALMMASDAWNGTHFLPQYKKPMTDLEKNALLQQSDLGILNQKGVISKEELNMLHTQLGGLMQSEKYKEATAGKVGDQDEKDRQNLMKALDTEKASGRFTAVGKAQSNINQAQRIQALLDQYAKDPNKMPLTGPASLSEIAIGLNSLLSATGGSEESRKSLIPSSVRGRYSTLEQFVMNEPTGANMAAFVHNAADTLKREQQTNQKQIDAYRDHVKGGWSLGRYAKRHPDEFNQLIDNFTAPAEAPAQTNIEAEKEAIYKQFPHLRPKK